MHYPKVLLPAQFVARLLFGPLFTVEVKRIMGVRVVVKHRRSTVVFVSLAFVKWAAKF